MSWKIGNQEFNSRFLLGTALYPNPQKMLDSISAAKTEIITVSLRRQSPENNSGGQFWQLIKDLNCHILPNTAGCHNVKEAVTTAQMAREIFNTNWIKLEVIGDEYTLQPDPVALLEAAAELIKQDFVVFPYTTYDLVIANKLVNLGCDIIMPWASPIGSGKGLENVAAMQTLRNRLEDITLIVDAGIGRPSDATLAMELGFDAVLLNSAVALATNPVKMASAFKDAIASGRQAYEAGIMPQRELAAASTPVIGTPFWHLDK